MAKPPTVRRWRARFSGSSSTTPSTLASASVEEPRAIRGSLQDVFIAPGAVVQHGVTPLRERCLLHLHRDLRIIRDVEIPVEGRVWLDAATGDILRTELRFESRAGGRRSKT